MIGSVSYYNSSRRFVLLTPVGKSREYDIFGCDVWFFVAGLGAPYLGQIVEFEVSPDTNGKIEAVKVRAIRLQPPITEPGIKLCGSIDGGAAAGGRESSPSAAAGNSPRAA
ncbi:hypothetical protein LJR220_001659 [Bradyrhizobium sp. LjRoot220]|uniref:hypothetical protein n=1 Tax=Bradyrhizobium sp. LjRoot220 TaxID=3342284 RepID=UPI003ECFC1BC